MKWKAITIGIIFYLILGLVLGNSKEDLRIPIGDSDLILNSGLLFTIISAIIGGVITAFVAKDKFIKSGVLTGLLGGILIGIFLVIIVVYFPTEARTLFSSSGEREILRANIQYLFLMTTAMFSIVGIIGSTIGSFIGKYVIKKKYLFALTLVILFGLMTVIAYAIHPIVLPADFKIESIEITSEYNTGGMSVISDVYTFNKTQTLINIKWAGKTVEQIKNLKGESGEGYCGQIGLSEFNTIDDLILKNVNSWKSEYTKPPLASIDFVYVYFTIYTNRGARKTSFTLKDANVPDSLKEVVEKLIDIGKVAKGSCP
jgi:MFS family permease